MTGKVLQERIAAVSNIPFNTIAERIGVSAQSMYQFFTARHSWATIARNDLHIGKDTINEALNHVDSTMTVTDTYIRRSFDNINEANRLVVEYIIEKSQ